MWVSDMRLMHVQGLRYMIKLFKPARNIFSQLPGDALVGASRAALAPPCGDFDNCTLDKSNFLHRVAACGLKWLKQVTRLLGGKKYVMGYGEIMRFNVN